MSIPCKKRASERGQAILLVVVAMGIVLLGALGFAIDGSQLFAQRRMAQAAADAAAQAAIMSVYDNTNRSGSSHYFDAGSGVHTCASSDPTPCYYAETFNGFNGTTCPATLGSDCVTWEPDPADVTAPNLSSIDNPNRIRVTVSRVVPTTLMRFLGTSVATISARGTAAILSNPTRAQIIVTGNGPSAFSASGATLTVSGGANRTIQVNSSDPDAVAVGGTVNLLTGADFGVWGGPNTAPFTLSTGTYVQPGSPIPDPLAGLVSPPPVPSPPPSPNPTPLSPGVNGCPPSVGPGSPCMLYSPGLYTSNINVVNQTAVFAPGIYYMQGASFASGLGGYMYMASSPSDPITGSGMLVYLTGSGNINVGSGGTINLLGTPLTSIYQGILFYSTSGGITLDTTGNLTLTGTIYSPFSTLNLQGTGAVSLTITGDIITNRLAVSGAPTVFFSGTATVYNTRQVALVN